MKNLTVKTTDWTMTDEIARYLDEKLVAIDKLLSDQDADTIRCDVQLGKSRDQHAETWRAEMNLFVGGAMHRAEAHGETLQAALDEVKDEMSQQLRKTKQKHASLLRKGGAAVKDWLRFGK
jgi:ribosomal subunit interface protein